MPNLFTLVLQIAVILAVCRLMGTLFRKFHQPRVVGEMFAGILLGPSLLGWISPQFSAYLFPPSSLGFLNALSQVGVVIFMFLVGLGINPKELKHQSHAAVLVSHVSITAPFVLASLLALYLYPRLSDDSVSFTNFALFMGAAMSITAFPVLARILVERDMMQSRLGTLAIACAAVDDVTGWCILAYIVVLIRAAHEATSIWMTLGGIVLFVAIMIYGVRFLLRGLERSFQKRGEISENRMAFLLLLALASALCTERLGIHLLFGSFLMGAIMPKEPKFVRYILDRFETITITLLLPLFFAFTGLRTNVGLFKGPAMWFYCGLIILVATGGKLGGSTIAGWLSGMPLREAAGLGTLMNTRGLMELVILNIGLDIKVISPALFSMMVLMALFTTFMTTPVLELMCPDQALRTTPQKIGVPGVSLSGHSQRTVA
ncbi:MAG TPA: cation:proton antiporter [Candidatus Dormibacteraeota bacterium]|nr:cation:proton antiporter [Candidatus Dormibacteraeota bacterium]